MNGTERLPVVPEKVDAVLLADGWHKVALGSFTVGALGFGAGDDRGVLGYRFEEISNGSLHRSATLAGPLAAVLAVRQVTSRRPAGLPSADHPALERAHRTGLSLARSGNSR
jgi:hypothetical protein